MRGALRIPDADDLSTGLQQLGMHERLTPGWTCPERLCSVHPPHQPGSPGQRQPATVRPARNHGRQEEEEDHALRERPDRQGHEAEGKEAATTGCREGRLPLRQRGACTAFHTAERFTGSAIGGLAGADATCTALANSAGIAGTFKAWLSAGNASPATRFDNINLAGPWVLPRIAADGASPPTVAANFQDLITCGATCLQTAINRNQNGGTGDGVVVWTATRADGSAVATNCSSWTSDDGDGLTGLAAQTDTAWTDSTVTISCNLTFSLYCFQQAT